MQLGTVTDFQCLRIPIINVDPFSMFLHCVPVGCASITFKEYMLLSCVRVRVHIVENVWLIWGGKLEVIVLLIKQCSKVVPT